MSVFKIAADAIDPAIVPFKVSNRGARIPAVGIGTFGSDHASPEAVAQAVREAISLGYRHVDCARVYGNEAEIGTVLAEILASGGIRREELWITSKVWNDMHSDGDVLLSLAHSLKDLRLAYLDLFLIRFAVYRDTGFHSRGLRETDNVLNRTRQ